MAKIKSKFPWISIFNIAIILIAIPLVNPWIRKNGDSTSAMILGVGATLLTIMAIDFVLLKILRAYRKGKKSA